MPDADMSCPDPSGEEPEELSVEQALALGSRMHRAGRLEEAGGVYRQVLARVPEHPGALNLLAILSYQQGNLGDAVAHIERAVAASPDDADIHNNLGNLKKLEGRLDQARAAYERSIALDPRQADAYNNLGIIYRARGLADESIAAYSKAIELNPKLASAFHNIGVLHASKRRFDEAIDAFRGALALDAGLIEASIGIASALYRIGRLADAAEVYRQLLARDPDHPIARHMLSACTTRGVPDRASDAFVRALFGRFADEFDERLAGLEYRGPQLVVDAVTARCAPPRGELDVLDAGCGTGLCGPLVRGFARRLTGVDLSIEMLRKARQRGYDELVEAELVGFLQQHADSYDVVISADTLIYFGALDEAMRAAARALRAGGWLVFTVEQDDGADAVDGYRITPSGRYCHTREYVRDRLERACLTVDGIHDVHLRVEMGAPVLGMLVVARRPIGA